MERIKPYKCSGLQCNPYVKQIYDTEIRRLTPFRTSFFRGFNVRLLANRIDFKCGGIEHRAVSSCSCLSVRLIVRRIFQVTILGAVPMVP